MSNEQLQLSIVSYGHCVDQVNEDNDGQDADSDHCVFQQVPVKGAV